MENLGLKEPFGGVYKDRRVFVTGHTGFKGSWLCLWLQRLGARVTGYSLGIPSHPNHFELLNLEIRSLFGDIEDYPNLAQAIEAHRPEIVFHLAAQAIVRKSYVDPVATFRTNVLGTVHLLDICRRAESVKAIVNITSDKCYENQEWAWGYRENDRMGGDDPYSASKGCAELVTSSFRHSFFPAGEYGKSHRVLLASARAGNVIGGGDWAEDRLIPDVMRATAEGRETIIRNPHAVRPWQHVLEPLSGYLGLGAKLLAEHPEYARAWNFGPQDRTYPDVSAVVQILHGLWNKIAVRTEGDGRFPETKCLMLDSTLAHRELAWKPQWPVSRALAQTVEWYRAYYETGRILSSGQLDEYIRDAASANAGWAPA